MTALETDQHRSLDLQVRRYRLANIAVLTGVFLYIIGWTAVLLSTPEASAGGSSIDWWSFLLWLSGACAVVHGVLLLKRSIDTQDARHWFILHSRAGHRLAAGLILLTASAFIRMI